MSEDARLATGGVLTREQLSKAFQGFLSEKYDSARESFEAYLNGHGGDWRARLWFARTLAELGNTERALEELETVAKMRPESTLPAAFGALVLHDSRRFEEATEYWASGAWKQSCVLGDAIARISAVWNGEHPSTEIVNLMRAANPDIRGRALHIAETRLSGLPEPVLRDFMDEIGLGWPGYKIPPPWFSHLNRTERRIWRLMAQGRTEEAFEEAAACVERLGGPRKKAQTFVAAAIMVGRWEIALKWACAIKEYAAFVSSDMPPSGYAAYQLRLFRGFCTLFAGSPADALDDLSLSALGDRTSYLPHYALGRAFVINEDWTAARRAFVATNARVNPSLATERWKELVHQGFPAITNSDHQLNIAHQE